MQLSAGKFEVLPGINVVGVDTQGVLELDDCLVVILRAQQPQAEGIADRSVAGIGAQLAAKKADHFFEILNPSPIEHRKTKIALHGREIGLDRQRCAKTGDGLVQLPACGQCCAEVAVRIDKTGVDRERLPVLRDSLFHSPVIGQGVGELKMDNRASVSASQRTGPQGRTVAPVSGLPPASDGKARDNE